MSRYTKKVLAVLLCVGLTISFCACDKKGNEVGKNESAVSEPTTESIGATEEESTANVDVKTLDYSKAALIIESGGSYTIDKEIEGTVVIHTKEALTLTLKNATVKGTDGPAIYVVNCGGFTLIAEGENTLSDGAVYTGSFAYAKGTVSAEDDLCIKGDGSIAITGNYGHGISCDDSLVIDGGNLTVKAAAKDALHANDLVEINGGKLCVEGAEGDAIESEGLVQINGGVISLNSKGDGIKAALNGKTDVVCDIKINGGEITVNTDEDGIQSDGALAVNNGSIDITTTGAVANNAGGEGQWQGGMGGGMRPGGGKPGDRPNGNMPVMPDESAPVMPDESAPVMPDESAPIMPDDTTISDSSASDSSKGIKATGDLTINGGSIKVSSTDDALHSDASVLIGGGEIELSTSDDGIHAEGDLTINSGSINILKSYEGLEGKVITLNDGNVSIVASDDGINATSGGASGNRPGNANADNSLIINGGVLYMRATGDGLDSNGLFEVNGGVVMVDCASSGADSPLDADGSRLVNGGVVIATGAGNMLENPTAGSKQCCVVLSGISLAEGTTIAVANSEGKALMCYTLSAKATTVTLSLPEFEIGQTYTLYGGVTPVGEGDYGSLYYGDGIEFEGGSEIKQFTATSTVTQNGMGRF